MQYPVKGLPVVSALLTFKACISQPLMWKSIESQIGFGWIINVFSYEMGLQPIKLHHEFQGWISNLDTFN